MFSNSDHNYTGKQFALPRQPPPFRRTNGRRAGAPMVMVLGVCLCDRPNNAERIIENLAATTHYEVTQQWITLGSGPAGPMLSGVIRYAHEQQGSKYELLNKLLSGVDLSPFEYVVIVDDDIALPDRFLDNFLSLQTRFDLRLAQPARTPNSYIDHWIVRQVEGVTARETRFVESGPVVSLHRSVFHLLLPFNMTSPMGWGYENVWAYRLSQHNLRMGIIDACAVDHSLRAPGSYYDRGQADEARKRLLDSQRHLTLAECYTTLDVMEDSRRAAPSSVRQIPRKQEAGVNVSGYFASEKGVGEAVRADLRALEAAKIPYVLNNVIDPRSLNHESAGGGFSDENPYPINLIHVGPDTLPGFVRRMGEGYFTGRYNIGFWAWELSEFPQRWQPTLEHLDEVWVPSTFVQAAVSSGTRVPVCTVPHCVSEVPVKSDKTRADFALPASSFLFLFAFDFDSGVERKNPLGLITAFKRAFTPSDDTILLLKCCHADGQRSAFDALRDAAAGARILIIDRVLNRSDMNALMALADCYVSLHRSEGFGLTLAEAMALGKPVIATQYSGNLDFMTCENSFLVPHELVEIQEDLGYYSKGCTWADPDLDHAARLMRHVFEYREDAVAVGKKAREDVLSRLHPSVVGRIMKDRLVEIMSPNPRPETDFTVTGSSSLPVAGQDTASVRQLSTHMGTALTGVGALPPECSIIIPAYNNSALTLQCLDALLSSTSGSVSFEVIVVDDGSTDSTQAELRPFKNAIRLVARKKNSGFATACNEGAAIAKADLLVFLNNDTVPQPGWLDAMVHHARNHPRAAIVGSKLLFPDGTIQHAGVVVGQSRFPRHIHLGLPGDHPAVNVTRPFQAVTGACMLVRRHFFEEAGGFDVAFLNGFEDIDLCYRAGERGFEVHYCHQSVLIHLQSATRAGRAQEEFRNCELYQARWSSRIQPDEMLYQVRDSQLGLEPPPASGRPRIIRPRAAPARKVEPGSTLPQSRARAGVPCATLGLPGRMPDQNLVMPRRAPP